ncbi:MAG: glycine cleavage system protein GcvH [Proteobacteria bacterium]|nr:glycine cleavage system protein GcvH [Pseudomonadota bacterium]MCH8213121.1 glycine cleavage system protein GcvH [Pseudomonadota bacterium]
MGIVRYTKEHEWIRVEDGVGVVGITKYAQEQLGDIVYVELPEVGAGMTKGAEAAVVESVKAASEIYAPVGGEVTEVNQNLADNPGTVNTDAMGEGWFFKMRIADTDEVDRLMDGVAYQEYVESLS